MSNTRSDLVVSRRDGRYELHDGDELLSFAPYSEVGGVVVMPHVETRVQHRGSGYSSALMAGVVDDLRARRLRIDPICWVARQYVSALDDADELTAR